ncbi:MAG TPA: lanthionine synthetase LanC family protein [Novosphingobium sp.]|nr:lanthionine synthetase LanC family protein [Novosphingobium sp.]
MPVSRRSLLQAGPFAVGAGALLAAEPLAAAESAGPAPAAPGFSPGGDYLAMARSAADWIISTQSTDEFGAFFPADAANPKRFFMAPSAADSYYCGIAGMVLMFAELARTTGEPRYREAAMAGADRLLIRWPAIANEVKSKIIDMRWNMIFGLSGIGMALYQAGLLLNEPRYTAALGSIADRIASAANPANPKGTWTEFAGYIGDSSTLLFLTHAARILNNKRYLRLATQAGDRLLALSTKESDGSLAWRGPQNPSMPHLYYPGFEMGTAGVAFTLASLAEATGQARFLDGARRGAAHLMSLAVSKGNAALIPYAFPDYRDLFYLGFCHGAAGTARTFYKLHQLTGDRLYLDWTNRLAEGILAAGAPELESPGMWNTVTQCCGTASQVTLFLGLWATFGNPSHLEIAQRAGRTIASRANNIDGKGNKWFMAWQRIEPSIVNAEAGYMIGAAGIATSLLHLHLAETGRYEVSLPFDNPFPRTRRS